MPVTRDIRGVVSNARAATGDEAAGMNGCSAPVSISRARSDHSAVVTGILS